MLSLQNDYGYSYHLISMTAVEVMDFMATLVFFRAHICYLLQLYTWQISVRENK